MSSHFRPSQDHTHRQRLSEIDRLAERALEYVSPYCGVEETDDERTHYGLALQAIRKVIAR